MCRGMSEGTATAVPSRPTTYTRESRSHERSAWPLQRGVQALHTVFLFRLSPKVGMNRIYVSNDRVPRRYAACAWPLGMSRGCLVVLGRNNPSPYTVNGRPLYVHLNGLAIVLLK